MFYFSRRVAVDVVESKFKIIIILTFSDVVENDVGKSNFKIIII